MTVRLLRILCCLPLLGGLAGCLELGIGQRSWEAAPPLPPHRRMLPLEGSLDTLRHSFNQAGDQVRVVALLSPTCEACSVGAWAVRRSVLDAFPDSEVALFVVWIDVLPGDDREAACESSQVIDDVRARHYHDPLQRAGRAFAEGLLPTGLAWDTYLFYAPGQVWDDLPPRPTRWASQLGRIAGEHFRPREELFTALRDSMETLTGERGIATVQSATPTGGDAAVESAWPISH